MPHPLLHVVTQTEIEILWDVEIKQNRPKIKHNRPDNTRRKELATDLYNRP